MIIRAEVDVIMSKPLNDDDNEDDIKITFKHKTNRPKPTKVIRRFSVFWEVMLSQKWPLRGVAAQRSRRILNGRTWFYI